MTKENKLDGFANLFTALGTSKDRREYDSIKVASNLPDYICESLYRSDGLATACIDIPIETMISKGYKIENDIEDKMFDAMDSTGIDILSKCKEHLTWNAVYGGSLMVFVVDDGGELKDPLNINTAKSLKAIQVFDRTKITVDDAHINKNPQSPNFEQPEYYTINPTSGIPFLIHHSRTHRLSGKKVPARGEYLYNIWGDSQYTKSYQYIKRAVRAYDSTDAILDDFIQSVLKIENLQALIASGQEEAVKKRIEILSMSKSILRTLLIGTGEEYTKNASTVSGLDKVIQEFCQALASVERIPVSILMTRSPAGLNSTGESEFRTFYDHISFRQRIVYKPLIRKILDIMVVCNDYGLSMLEAPKIVFNPLYEPTLDEYTKAKKAQAEVDKMYYEMDAVTNIELRHSRFGGEEYSFTTVIDESNDKMLEENDKELQNFLSKKMNESGEDGEI